LSPHADELKSFKASHVCQYLEQLNFSAKVVATIREAHVTGKTILQGLMRGLVECDTHGLQASLRPTWLRLALRLGCCA
jgi:hypothetical protein